MLHETQAVALALVQCGHVASHTHISPVSFHYYYCSAHVLRSRTLELESCTLSNHVYRLIDVKAGRRGC